MSLFFLHLDLGGFIIVSCVVELITQVLCGSHLRTASAKFSSMIRQQKNVTASILLWGIKSHSHHFIFPNIDSLYKSNFSIHSFTIQLLDLHLLLSSPIQDWINCLVITSHSLNKIFTIRHLQLNSWLIPLYLSPLEGNPDGKPILWALILPLLQSYNNRILQIQNTSPFPLLSRELGFFVRCFLHFHSCYGLRYFLFNCCPGCIYLPRSLKYCSMF